MELPLCGLHISGTQHRNSKRESGGPGNGGRSSCGPQLEPLISLTQSKRVHVAAPHIPEVGRVAYQPVVPPDRVFADDRPAVRS